MPKIVSVHPTHSVHLVGRWLIPVFVLVLSLTVGGGLLAREFYQRQDYPPSASAPGGSGSNDQPGSSTVELAMGAAMHPEGTAIRELLQTYFDAINARDYQRWKTVVSAARAHEKSLAQWQADYRSTQDGGILVHRVDTLAPRQLRVLVAFTSIQDVSAAPPDMPETCIRWRLALPVIVENQAWKLDTVPTGPTGPTGQSGNTPEREKC